VSWFLRRVGSLHGDLVYSRRTRVLASFLAELIPQGHTVLDVGCGDGLIDALVTRQRPDLQISGVDVLVRPTTHIPVTAFDGTRLPFPDRSSDSVLICDVLHHADHPVGLLQECARVARHSVVIKDHTVKGFLARPTLRFMDFVGNAPQGVALPYNYLTIAEWEAAFRECGLVPRTVRTDLGLYPPVADAIFGRSLHFVGRYEVAC
jgi:ubiquinone/menaquinone biosynthesis C-methylase UbiE